MDSVKDILEEYFEDLNKTDHHSNLSWENCYKFFRENHQELIKSKDSNELLNIAALQLAFYLASWGMYRGNTFLRQYDHTVYKKLILNLLKEYNCLFENENNFAEWDDLEMARKYITEYFEELQVKDKKYKNKPTQTLITKILMGIFGCIIAYDRFVIKALNKYNEEHKDKKEEQICKTFNKKSYEKLKDWWAKNKYINVKSNIKYPPMKLIDVYFWTVGKKLEETEKENKEH